MTASTSLIDISLVTPIFESITTTITELLPYGLGIMGLMVGIGLIPRLVHKFL